MGSKKKEIDHMCKKNLNNVLLYNYDNVGLNYLFSSPKRREKRIIYKENFNSNLLYKYDGVGL